MMTTALALALLLALQAEGQQQPHVDGAPGSQEETPTATTTRAQRLQSDRDQLQAFIEHEAKDGIGPAMLQVVSKSLESMGEANFAPSTVGGVKRKELDFLNYWNNPQADRAGVIPAEDFENPQHLPAMLRTCSQELAKLNAELLVVSVPLRLQIYPEHLQGFEEPEGFIGYGAGVAKTLHHLTEGGVQVLNLLPAFVAERNTDREDADARLFLDYDIHWTPRGAILTADLIAERIKASDWFTQGPFHEGKGFYTRREKGSWTVAKNRRLELEVAKGPVDVWYERIVTSLDVPAHQSNKFSEILIVGDSFSGVFKSEGADIVSLLYARLGHRMDIISVPGGGQALWKSLGRRGREGLDKKRIVIWLTSVIDFKRAYKPTSLFGD